MKTRRPFLALAVLVAPIFFPQFVTSQEKSAATSVPPPPPAQSLPRPDFRFKGQVGRTYQDSDPPTFPQVVRPPKGAPNVLLILLDDAGFGQFSRISNTFGAPFGGRDRKSTRLNSSHMSISYAV